MCKKNKKEIEVVRYNPDTQIGLSDEQVEQRKKDKLTNKTKIVVGKTYFQIIMNNLFSVFNILLYLIAILMIIGEYYSGLFFLVILFFNTAIGLYQDIKARVLMGKLRVVTAPKANVVRSGIIKEIMTDELVLDDIVILKTNSQICADSILIKGSCSVNESLLTGESRNINKNINDILYSGSYVTSGAVYARVDKVGKDSYIETVQSKAKAFSRSPSQILKSLSRLFFVIGIVVISLGTAMVIAYGLNGSFSSFEKFQEMVGPLSGSLVAMIPSGLYLLTSTALAVGVIALARKKAQVQDFYSIEMLSRADVLCVDKTGTITDGTMEVKEIVPLNNYNSLLIKEHVSDIINATKDDNFTALALKKYFTSNENKMPTQVLPFSSENKYSGASFGNVTYVIGAAEFMPLINKGGVISRSSKYTSKGYRVLVLGKSIEPFKDNKISGKVTPLALIIIQDHIKEDAPSTFAWFNESGVSIKVISGDNVETVKEIAKAAGIANYDKYISLEGKTSEEVYSIANDYCVFGRVSPEQKEAIIRSLKDHKHVVAMTGDGVNDILALKRADCSIAMASGSEATRNVSHIVLLDNNFARLPDIVGEGRRVVNNISRTSSLFLVKTIFAFVLTSVFFGLFLSGNKYSKYPFSTNNLYIWEIFGIGISAFFLALEKNNEIIRGGFLSGIFKKAVPSAVLLISSVFLIYLGAYLQEEGILYTGIQSFGFANVPTGLVSHATAMCVITFTLLSIPVLYFVCYPLDKYRRIVFIGTAFFTASALTLFGLLQYFNIGFGNLLKVDFLSLTGVNFFVIGLIFFSLLLIYFFIFYIIHILKTKNINIQKINK